MQSFECSYNNQERGIEGERGGGFGKETKRLRALFQDSQWLGDPEISQN